jgi:hypothetical protein
MTFAAVLLIGACGGTGTNTGETTGNAACQNGNCTDGIGDACTPGDESSTAFPGFGATEVNIEDRTTQCATGICIAAHFQGRVSCPYGGPDCMTRCPYGSDCTTPSGTPVAVDVKPQLVTRPPSSAVYCSCRCDGPEGTGPFCACPNGFECSPLVEDIGIRNPELPVLAGSYCIKAGTAVPDPVALSSGPVCDAALHNCDDR